MGSTLIQAGLGAASVVAGAAIPGPAGILVAGAFAIVGGLLYQPKRVDAQRPNIQFPVGSPGRVVPRIIGTDMAESVGYDFFGNVRFREQTEDVGKGSQEVTTGFQVLCDLGCTVCMGEGDILQIYREGVLIFDTQSGGVQQALTGALRLYRGTMDQLPDPVEQALYGIEVTSGYPEIIRFTLQDHDISDINRAPTFKCLVTRAATPNFPKEKIDIYRRFISAGALPDGNTIYAHDGGTVTVFNLATGQLVSNNYSGTTFRIIEPLGVDFDGNLYSSLNQPAANSKWGRMNAPDYSTSVVTSAIWDGAGGGGAIVTNGPLATSREQQILIGVNGDRVSAWRLTTINGFPDTFIYRERLLDGAEIFNASISGSVMARDPVTGNVFILGESTSNDNFYVGVWEPLNGAMIRGNGGTINHPMLPTTELHSMCYVPQTREFAVQGETSAGIVTVYFLDPDDYSLIETWTTGLTTEFADQGRSVWSRGPDSKGRIFLPGSSSTEWPKTEIDLVNRQVLKTYSMGDWGMPNQSSSGGTIYYDEQRRALWFADNQTGAGGPATWILYLDRATGQGTDLASLTAELINLTALDPVLDFDGTDVAPVAVKGGRFEDGTIAQFLKPYYDFHQCRYISSQFKIRAFRRSATPILTIPKMHLGAAELGGVAPLLTRPSDRPLALPQAAEVGYRRASDYLNDQQEHARAPTAVISRDKARLNYPGPLDEDEAKAGAIRRLDEIHLGERSYQSSLPPYYLNLEPGDCVAVEDETDTRICETAEASPTLIGVINWVGVRADDRALSRAGAGAPTTVPPQSLQPLVASTPVILDTPLLLETLEGNSPTLNLSVRQDTAEAPRTALIQRSPAGAELWADYASIEGSRIMQSGVLKAPLAAGPTTVFDLVNTIHCTLDRGSLASAPDQATVLADETINAYAVEVDNAPENGGRFQLGQFVAAALQADNSYILSQLYRGRRDTDNQVAGGSSAGKRIYFLALGQMAVKAIPYSDVGLSWDYRAFTVGANTPGPVITRETVGDSKREYRSTPISGQLLTPPNTWEVVFHARSRFSQSGSMEAPPLSAPLDFEADMLDGPEGSPVAGATITTNAADTPNGSVITVDSTSARMQKLTIQAADQVAWFGSVQGTIHLAVYYIADIGRGHPLYVSYTGVPST